MTSLDYEALLKENQALKYRISQFKNLLDSIPDPVFMKDENLRWIYGNPVILNLYNIDKNNYIGKTEDQLLPEEFAESCMESDRQAVAKRTISKSEEQARDSDGELHYYEVFKVPSYNESDGKFNGLIGVGRDITERKLVQEALETENRIRREHEESLAHLTETLEQQVIDRTMELESEKERAERLAYTDTLTGLNNRRAFYQNSYKVDQQARQTLSTYAVIALDIDNFKRINDTYGHAIGDEVLQSLAEIITKMLGISDVHGRIGGDEFTITLYDTSLDDAITLAQNMCSEISSISLQKNNNDIPVTASFGVSEYHISSTSFEEILAKADEALYQAKTSGRNKVISKVS